MSTRNDCLTKPKVTSGLDDILAASRQVKRRHAGIDQLCKFHGLLPDVEFASQNSRCADRAWHCESSLGKPGLGSVA
ncbi:MAG: hypothetical protein H0X34_09680 [Chthoniobacterales bacterium]|nr:hypothetical protein [Chthoniobacterales bacterium]